MANQSAQNINSDFFKGIYKEVWRKETPKGLTEAEVDFIEEMANLKKQDAVLDIMCGYGRHALELAKRGYRVTAVDNSKEYIDELENVAGRENLSVHALLQDVSQARFSENFEAVICMGNSFAFFDAEAGSSILQEIARCLHSGGVFIINTWTVAEIAIQNFQERTWHYVDDYKLFTESKFLFNPTRIESDYTILAATGKMETLKAIDYIFSFAEIKLMLNKAGFDLSEVYSTPRKRKYIFGDGRAYIVAVKQ